MLGEAEVDVEGEEAEVLMAVSGKLGRGAAVCCRLARA